MAIATACWRSLQYAEYENCTDVTSELNAGYEEVKLCLNMDQTQKKEASVGQQSKLNAKQTRRLKSFPWDALAYG